MGKEDIKIIDIKDFKNNRSLLDYVDDDFAIVSSFEEAPHDYNTIRLGCFLFAICLEGRIQMDINYKTYQLEAGNLLLGLPNTVISHVMLSPGHKVRLAGFSTSFLQRIFKMEKEMWDTTIHIYNNPVKFIGKKEDKRIPTLYRDLIMAKFNDDAHSYHREVMQHLFSALFCEMMGRLNKEIASSNETDSPKEGIKQADYILRKFMLLLSEDNGTHRSVAYYADALCYSPKHLSKVIKQTCGKTPLEFINENTIKHIKYRLKHSDKSIKEIAEEFNFANQSFFGKYVKAHLGMPPALYRSAKEE